MAKIGAVLGFVDSDSEDELPAGWEERTTEDGRVFYANHGEKSTQWTHPRTGKRKRLEGEMPDGWERKVLDDGVIVFVNHLESRTTYTDPRLAFAVEDNENLHRNEGDDIKTRPRQRYDGSSKPKQILHGLDLSNQTFLITGANSGIGFETAKSLALHNAHVVMVCRNLGLAEKAKSEIEAQKINAKIDILLCDLSSLRSVRQCAEEFLRNKWPLHVLIINAAIQGHPFTKSEDGFEMTFAVNYLGHFYLTKLLTNKLVASAPSRVVVVSSESHRFVDIFGQLNSDTLTEENLSPSISSHYWWMHAYNMSKLCLLLFGLELNEKLQMRKVCCNTLHPGNMISTNLMQHSCLLRTLFTLVRPFTKSQEQGAATSVFCAVASELEDVGGKYFNNCWYCEPSKLAENEKLRKKIWRMSEEMIERALSMQTLQ